MTGTFHSLSDLILLTSTYCILQIRKLRLERIHDLPKTMQLEAIQTWVWLQSGTPILVLSGARCRMLTSPGCCSVQRAWLWLWKSFSYNESITLPQREKRTHPQSNIPKRPTQPPQAPSCLRLPFPSVAVPQLCGLPQCFHLSRSGSPTYTNSYSLFFSILQHTSLGRVMHTTTTTTNTLVC